MVLCLGVRAGRESLLPELCPGADPVGVGVGVLGAERSLALDTLPKEAGLQLGCRGLGSGDKDALSWLLVCYDKEPCQPPWRNPSVSGLPGSPGILVTRGPEPSLSP